LLKPELILCDFDVEKPKQRCSICGEFKKGHKCKGPIDELELKNKLKHKDKNRCPFCGKHKKGHFCEQLKRVPERLKKFTKFMKLLIKIHKDNLQISSPNQLPLSNIIISNVGTEELSGNII